MAIAEEEEEEAAEEPAGQCCTEAMSCPFCCACLELAHCAACTPDAVGLHGPGSAVKACPACCLTCVLRMVSQLCLTW